MIAWLLYTVMVGVLLSLAAQAADRVLRLQRKPSRWVWVVALLASVAIPAVWPRLPRTVTDDASLLVPASFTIQLDAIGSSQASDTSWTLADGLLAGWLALSVMLLVYGVVALVRVRAARRGWRCAELAGEPVLVTGSTGPAVVGFIRPAIVVPEWVHTLSADEQRLIIAHERSHIEARDPWLVMFAHLLPALLPWNVLIWWQARRLREAIELDCDARLLQADTPAHGYADLLLNVGRRASGVPLAVAALSEPRSLLEKRIRRMFERRPRYRLLRTGGWLAVAVLAITGAMRAPLPGEVTPAIEVAEAAVERLVPLAADTTPPELLNSQQVREATTANYPPLLRDAGIEGSIRVRVEVTAQGEVASARVAKSSGQAPLDEAALRVAGVMRFKPASFNGRTVATALEVEVVFTRAPVREMEAAERAEVAARTQAAAIANYAEIAEITNRTYPASLRSAGIGGRVQLRLLVAANGTVERQSVSASSGVAELDEAALQVARSMRFAGGAPGWVEVPVDFRPAAVEPQMERRARPSIQDATQPVFIPYTVPPKLANPQAVEEALNQHYPTQLREAGIGGTVNMWFFIDESGRVVKTQLKRSSGNAALDEAAANVAALMTFTPALNRDKKVNVWVEMPIVFKAATEVRRRSATEADQVTIEARRRAELAQAGAEVRPRSESAVVRALAPRYNAAGSTARGALPRIANGAEVERALQRFYPPLLRDAGIGGTVMLVVTVDPDGSVVESTLRESSGHTPLDQAARKVAEVMRFEPTGRRTELAVPISFRTN